METHSLTEPVLEVEHVKYEEHPLTNFVPWMSDSQYPTFEDDISHNGLREPIVLFKGMIVSGRVRYKACLKLRIEPKFRDWEGEESDLLKWIISTNHRRDFTKSQRALMALQVEPELAVKAKANNSAGGGDKRSKNRPASPKIEKPFHAAEEAARMCGARPAYMHDLKNVKKTLGEDESQTLFQEIKSGLLNVPAVVKLANVPKEIRESALTRFKANKTGVKRFTVGARIKMAIEDAEREARNRVPHNLPQSGERFRLIHASFADLIDKNEIEPESIDLIFADPWYFGDCLDHYEQVAKLAGRVLKPGGSLLAMTGNMHQYEIQPRMCKHIPWHWTINYSMPGKHSRVHDRNVSVGWKPVLWFVKGKYKGPDVHDVVVSNKPEKDHHDHQQSVSGITALLKQFPDAMTILDPCVGFGTTAVAALRLGRQFVGADIDPERIKITAEKIDAELTAQAVKARDVNDGQVATIHTEIEAEDKGMIGDSLFSIAA